MRRACRPTHPVTLGTLGLLLTIVVVQAQNTTTCDTIKYWVDGNCERQEETVEVDCTTVPMPLCCNPNAETVCDSYSEYCAVNPSCALPPAGSSGALTEASCEEFTVLGCECVKTPLSNAVCSVSPDGTVFLDSGDNTILETATSLPVICCCCCTAACGVALYHHNRKKKLRQVHVMPMGPDSTAVPLGIAVGTAVWTPMTNLATAPSSTGVINAGYVIYTPPVRFVLKHKMAQGLSEDYRVLTGDGVEFCIAKARPSHPGAKLEVVDSSGALLFYTKEISTERTEIRRPSDENHLSEASESDHLVGTLRYLGSTNGRRLFDVLGPGSSTAMIAEVVDARPLEYAIANASRLPVATIRSPSALQGPSLFDVEISGSADPLMVIAVSATIDSLMS